MVSKAEKLLQVLLCMLFVAGTSVVSAQNSNDARPVTSTYYIKNANVVQSPTRTIPNASIVIKDGMIIDVGPNIAVPFDAEVIDADSMFVYAGFIDACSHAGVAKVDEKDPPSVENPGNPPKGLAGITPQQTVRGAMDGKVDKSLKELQELGFGFVHAVPQGRMLPGQGSILSTGDGAIEHLLVLENISQFSQFSGARRMFPATTIGVMSQFRDLMKNASYTSQHTKAYKLNASGMERPARSEELEALIPVVEKQKAVFFYTPKVKDVNRALILQSELGFNMVLTGVKQGWPLMSSITASRNPIVLSLDLPEEIKDKDASKDKDENDKADDDSAKDDEKDKGDEEDEDDQKDTKKEDEKKPDPELELMKAKKKESHDQYVGQAAMFEKQRVSFSFSTLDTKSKDIRNNILRMVKGGLSESGALAALTTNPAALLGMSSMAGTIEKGKIANIFITDKSYFDEKSKIKYLITDGVVTKTKEDKKKNKKSGSGDSKGIEGLWAFTVEIPGETQRGNIKIVGTGDDASISVSTSEDPDDFEAATNISISGSAISFDLADEGVTYSISIEIDGDDFEGSVKAGEFGTFPMTGNRVPE